MWAVSTSISRAYDIDYGVLSVHVSNCRFGRDFHFLKVHKERGHFRSMKLVKWVFLVTTLNPSQSNLKHSVPSRAILICSGI